MAKQVNARLIVDRVTIPCSEAIFSMRVLSGPNGKPDHRHPKILLDVYINIEDPSVKPVLEKVKELYNLVGGGGGSAASGAGPEMNFQVDFDDDFNPEGTLASVRFKGRIHFHSMVKVLNSPSSGVPDINVFHLQIAPTLNNKNMGNKKERPVKMSNSRPGSTNP
jgi:hypothetical protein